MSDFLLGFLNGVLFDKMFLNEDEETKSNDSFDYYNYSISNNTNYGLSKELVKFEVLRDSRLNYAVESLKQLFEEKMHNDILSTKELIYNGLKDCDELILKQKKLAEKVEKMGFTLTQRNDERDYKENYVSTSLLNKCEKNGENYEFSKYKILTDLNGSYYDINDLKNGKNFFNELYEKYRVEINSRYAQHGGIDNYVASLDDEINTQNSKNKITKSTKKFKNTLSNLNYYKNIALSDKESFNEIIKLHNKVDNLTEEEKQTLIEFHNVNQKLIDYSTNAKELEELNGLEAEYKKTYYHSYDMDKKYYQLFNKYFSDALKEFENKKEGKLIGEFINEFALFVAKNPKIMEKVSVNKDDSYTWSDEIIYNEGLVKAINQLIGEKIKENKSKGEKNNQNTEEYSF